MGKWQALENIFAIQLHNNGTTTYVLMSDIFGSACNMIWIKHYSWRKQEHKYAMDVYVKEHTMVAYNDYGWIDEFGGFWQLINMNIPFISISMNMSWMLLLMRLTWISISMVVEYKGTWICNLWTWIYHGCWCNEISAHNAYI